MTELLWFIATGIILYVVSDWVLLRLEAAAGRRFEHRSLVFFVILLVLALASFALIRRFAA